MFDFAWSEIALIGVVGLIFIGPKDMPTAVRAITDLLKKGRKLAGEFQTHVDEMVRDADLGEARDQFRQLRSMNIRGQVMKALDGDGALRRTLTDNPLSPVSTSSSTSIASAPVASDPVMVPATQAAAGREVTGAEMLRMRNRPHFVPGAATEMIEAELQQNGPKDDGLGDAFEDASDALAPSLIPPRTARQLARLRAQPPAPPFIPPAAHRPSAGLM